MKRIVAVALMALATSAGAQQPSALDLAANAVAQERQAGNNLVSLREQQLALVMQERDALKKELEKTKAEADKCKPKEEKR